MTVEAFSVYSERIGPVHRLTPVGELDIATATILERAFETAESGDAELIVVDLRRLSFMDSRGIHLLVQMDCACLGCNRLRLIAGASGIDRLLELAGVREHLPIVREDRRAVVRGAAADRQAITA